VGHVHLKTKFE